MSDEVPHRVDEVSTAYEAARKADKACGWLFYVLAILSLLAMFSDQLHAAAAAVVKLVALLLAIVLFALFVFSKTFFIPSAERLRRKQLLTDALGAPLIQLRTRGYYNNAFPPSHQRLAANVMENAFFGKEIAAVMLFSVRTKTAAYALLWASIVTYRHESMDAVLWITQLVFSADILAYWLSLEALRVRHERVFEDLHQHFVRQGADDDPHAIASVLDSFASYESTKASAGVLLDSAVFFKNNERLSDEWRTISERVGIPLVS